MRKPLSDKYFKLKKLLETRILTLDGAMGTLIQQQCLSETEFRGGEFAGHSIDLKGNNDILSLTQPEIIYQIHRRYLEAGADIIETNTFNANGISQSDYGLESRVYDINRAAATIARKAADEFTSANPTKPRFVAGSIGPTNQTASMSPDVNNPEFRKVCFEGFVGAYSAQARGLIDGGVDILLVETIFDTLNAKAAIFAINSIFNELKSERADADLPALIISGTITDSSGRTLSGQTVEAFWISIEHSPNLLAVGLNCALGSRQMKPYIEELSRLADCFISLYPNAGLPNAFGEYDESPEFMANVIAEYARMGFVNIIGGCCGTRPEHIAEFARTAAELEPRRIPKIEPLLRLSGLEPLVVRPESNFINIGERTNVAGSSKFKKLIIAEKFEEALQVARQQVDGGAQIIDVSMDDAMLDGERAMVSFLNMIASDPDISRVPIMLDSSKWSILQAGLKCLQGKGIVNSISLKEGESAFVDRALIIRSFGAAMVIMAFDEEGQAVTVERKMRIFHRAYKLLTEAGISPQDIIFDANVMTVATGMEEHNEYALSFIEAVRRIKSELPGSYTSGGISNVSFSFRANNPVREAMHSVFLYHAIKAGLDMGIVNAGQLALFDEIPGELRRRVEDAILNRRKDATDRLIELAETFKGAGQLVEKQDEWRSLPIELRLKHSLIKGIIDFAENDIAEARQKFSNPLEIIEKPLMEAMNTVGELFGSGKMFLPQVVKSARYMKKAISFLIPYIQSDLQSGGSRTRGKILLATVRGDVHDIGKNIVGVVLSCNNYEVIDLGVMTPIEKIIEAAIANNVDIIGLSGLITPSLEEMSHAAAELERNNIRIPLLIGGATTSRVHTAVKIFPNYSAPVIHVLDAGKSVAVVNSLTNEELKSDYIEKIKAEYNEIRSNFLKNASERKLLTLSQARANKPITDWRQKDITKPNKLGRIVFIDYSLAEIRKYINWTQFFASWEIKGRYPQIFDNPEKGSSARQLFGDAQELLDYIIENKSLSANAVIGLFPANSTPDDIIEIYSDESRKSLLAAFPTLRQQIIKSDGNPNLALSDYISPKESDIIDYIGAFALTAGLGIDKLTEKFESEGDSYKSILAKSIADRLAEAFAELLHLRVRSEFWGYEPGARGELDSLLAERYSGIRPAIGYPSLPDQSLNQTLFELLDASDDAGIELTESYMMNPGASVSGLYLAGVDAKYFAAGKIDKEQTLDYRRAAELIWQPPKDCSRQIWGTKEKQKSKKL